MLTHHQIRSLPERSADTVCDKAVPADTCGDSAEALARFAEDKTVLAKDLANLRAEMRTVKAKLEAAEARLRMATWALEEILEREG